MTYITMGQAEQIVPVARSTFRKHAKAGKIQHFKECQRLTDRRHSRTGKVL